MISYANRDWAYGSANSLDISTDAGAILESELRPALRIINIIEVIEDKYNISFTRNFLGSSQFNNLFMWLNQQTEGIIGRKETVIITNPLTGSPDAGNVTFYDNYVYITRQLLSQIAAVEYFATVTYSVYPTNPSITYNAYLVDENGDIVNEWLGVSGDQTFITEWKSDFELYGDESLTSTEQVKLVIEASQTLDFTTNLNVNYRRKAASIMTIFTDLNSTSNTNIIYVYIFISDNLPKMKVIDFLQGIMKMFKLIIRPLSGNQFYMNTLDGYYSDGNILDITPYVNQEEVLVERPSIYKNIVFKYQKTNNVLGKKFRNTYDPENDEIGYGDLKARYENITEKNDLSVELPFENMMFERMEVLPPSANAGALTNISIGQSISTSDEITFSKNNSKPILFYNNGLGNNSTYLFKVNFRGTIVSVAYNYIIGNTNDELLSQVTDTINFNAEIDPWHQVTVYNSLYENYWSNWIDTIYDLRQRKFTFEGNLPTRFVEELSLNDRLIIGNQRYKINDYKLNVNNGDVKLTLFNDIFDWDAYSFGTNFIHNSYKFNPNGWYVTDYNDNGDGTAYIYGNFNGYTYNTNTYGNIIKLKANGDVDTTFAPSSGFNVNYYGFQSIAVQPDGKLLATGNFTSFNGVAANRIVRINTDGSKDTSFVYGVGFSNITSGLGIDSQGKIVVGGSFSSYSGITSSRIARLESNGSLDIPFTIAIGTGFDNVTNSLVINSDDSIYVGGYFAFFDGASSNRIIKLTSGGTRDTSFNVGTGFNSNQTSQPVGLLPAESNGVYAYGYFTQYSGQSANRICKILPNGNLDPSFISYSGFNSYIYRGDKVMGDKLLLNGTYTQYNGLTLNGSVVLNSDGSIYRSFGNQSYINIFNIDNRFYGNLANGPTVMIADETLPTLSINRIVSNAGMKYYSINILKNEAWTLSKIDLGWGTNWVTLLTTSDSGAGECVIRVEEKASIITPDVYLPRHMDLLFNFNGIYRCVRISQNGLIQ